MVFEFLKKKKKEKNQKAQPELEQSAPSQLEDEASIVSSAEPNNAHEADAPAPEEVAPVPENELSEPVLTNEKTQNKTQDTTQSKPSYLSRLKAGLAKTGAGFGGLFLGKKAIDDDLLEDLETALLMADVGIEATEEIIQDITDAMSRNELANHDAVVEQLKITMARILAVSDKPLNFEKIEGKPFVLLMVGINGAGKTTTIGKIAQKLTDNGQKVMLAAGDTFRAAAVEQLKTWGERANVPVIAQGTGADSASVIYDAYESAKAKGIDVLIADTAGRLHTQAHLMSEIEKIVRVLKKHDPETPNEIMLVIDAGNGQNALNQAKEFHKSLGLTGITVTKLDGTAKGGIIFPIAKQLELPVRFIGVGESAEDLREFNANDFVEALLDGLTKGD